MSGSCAIINIILIFIISDNAINIFMGLKMRKYITILLLFILSCCNSKKINYTKIDYEVILETFEISFIKDDIKIPISIGEKQMIK